jgi:preprotein translocase subunit SecF
LFIASTLLTWWRERQASQVLVNAEPMDTSASSQDS